MPKRLRTSKSVAAFFFGFLLSEALHGDLTINKTMELMKCLLNPPSPHPGPAKNADTKSNKNTSNSAPAAENKGKKRLRKHES